MYLYHLDIFYDSRCALAEMFESNQVKPRPTYSPLGLEVIGLLTKSPSLFLANTLTFMEEK